jgi:hypothetical protein
MLCCWSEAGGWCDPAATAAAAMLPACLSGPFKVELPQCCCVQLLTLLTLLLLQVIMDIFGVLITCITCQAVLVQFADSLPL